MNFFLIIGPQAVGKMTVGQALARLTGAKLFYNHMTIDLIGQFFDYSTLEGKQLVKDYRNLLFDAVSSCKSYPGFIFTYVCDFNTKDGLTYVYETCEKFENEGHTAYIVELNADYETRKNRNTTENRIFYKKSKQDISKSSELFESLEKRSRSQSIDGEICWPRYQKIDNTKITPEETAYRILDHFHLH